MGLIGFVIGILLFIATGVNAATPYRRELSNTGFKDANDLIALYQTYKIRVTLNFDNANFTESEANEQMFELIDPCLDKNGIQHSCNKRTSYCDEGVYACASCATTCSPMKMMRWPDVKADCERVKMCAIFLRMEATKIDAEMTNTLNENQMESCFSVIVIMAALILVLVVCLGIVLCLYLVPRKLATQEQATMTTEEATVINMNPDKETKILFAPQSSACEAGENGQKYPLVYSQATNDAQEEKFIAYNKTDMLFRADIVERDDETRRLSGQCRQPKSHQNTVPKHMTDTDASQPLMSTMALSSSSSGISTSSEYTA